MFVGEESRLSGEAHSLSDLNLAFTHPASNAYIREAEPGDFLLGIGPDSTPLTTPFTLRN